MKWFIALLIVVMCVVHNDFWLWKDATLLGGVLPIGLGYHIGYSLLAAGAMAALVRYAWPHHLDDEPDPAAASGGAAAPAGPIPHALTDGTAQPTADGDDPS